MSTGNRKVELNIEKKLAELNLSPLDRAQAVASLRAAEDLLDFLEAVGAGIKRIAAVFSLRPSVRA